MNFNGGQAMNSAVVVPGFCAWLHQQQMLVPGTQIFQQRFMRYQKFKGPIIHSPTSNGWT
jgi:hypothetical protein